MKTWVLLILLLLPLAGFAADKPASVGTHFDAANKLYYEGKFAEAAAAYRAILNSGEQTPALFFNLGNALFKSGHLGEALAAYRQAEKQAPRDPDIRANIQFTQNQVQGPTMRPARWQRALSHLTLNEWATLFTISFWLLFLVLAAMQFKPEYRRNLKTPAVLLAVVTVILFVCTGFQHSNSRATLAFVTVPDAVVRAGPLEASKSVFTAHDGAELRVLEKRDDWLQVAPDEKRTGWIQKSAVTLSGPKLSQ